MSKALNQSIKNRLQTAAKERNLTFAELWHNLILERFLARLCYSKYKSNFILKGGSLLARYINLGRETRDLDFLVKKLTNIEGPLGVAFDSICGIDLNDGFSFEKLKISKLTHPHMNYTGAQVVLLAKLGGPQAHLQIDLGFGDIVDAIDHPIDLTSTLKGPLFESKIQVLCYPKEFIFAEKLETVIYRGSGNTRMKDFHDLYSLVSLPGCLDATYTEKVVISVFNHRQTALQQLPLRLDPLAAEKLQQLWQAHFQGLQAMVRLPTLLQEVIFAINTWLQNNTKLCSNND